MKRIATLRSLAWLIARIPIPGLNRPRFGVHLADSHVALLEARRTIQGIRFPRAELEPVVRPGNEEYRAAFRNLLERVDVSPGTRVSLAVPTSDVILRSAAFPALSGARLREAVQYEAEADLPFGTHELVYDYVRAPTGPEDTENRVLMVLARDRAIQDRVEVIRDSGLVPARVDVAALCLFRFWSQNCLTAGNTSFTRGGSELLVYVQSRSMDLVFYGEGRLLYARSLKRSGGKPTEFQAGPVPREDSAQMAGVSRVEFTRTVDHFRENLDGNPVGRVWVVRNRNGDETVLESIRQQFNVPVEAVNPKQFCRGSGSPDGREFMVPRGLIEQSVIRERTYHVNLVPSELRRHQNRKRRRREWIVLGVLSGLILLQVMAGFGWTYYQRQKQQEYLRREHQKIGPLADRVRSLQKRRRTLENALDRLRERTSQGRSVLSLLIRMGEPPPSLDAALELNEFKLRTAEEGPLLEIAGYARDYRSASRLYDWLTSRSPVVEQTSRKQSSVRGKQRQRVRFRARFSLRSDSQPAGRSLSGGSGSYP